MTVQHLLDSQKTVERTYVSPDASIRDVLRALASRNVGALVVSTDGEKVEGIISERDIVRGLDKSGDALLDKQARELMTEKVVTCVPGDKASGIMAVMIARHLRHVPVVNDGKFVSMLSIRDLLQSRLTKVQTEAEAMRSYIEGDMAGLP